MRSAPERFAASRPQSGSAPFPRIGLLAEAQQRFDAWRRLGNAAELAVAPDERYQTDRWVPTWSRERDARPEPALAILERWLTQESESRLAVVLGDYGVGKTFLCRMLAHEGMHLYSEGTSRRIPL